MEYDKVKFLRRRQFVLGNEYVEYDGWKKIFVEDGYVLTIHPDLQLTISENNNKKGILLGYFIDPFNPNLSDTDIINRILDTDISISKVSHELEKLSGRFVLIIKSENNLWLFHDACALRQVHYYKSKEGNVWCATQPDILAEKFNLPFDEDVLSYKNQTLFRLNLDEFWLITDRTPYVSIKYLLPNHYLDLHSGIVKRYWPNKESIGSTTVKRGIQQVSLILKNSIKSITNKFDNIKMGISAGCDSRKTLAAAKDFKEKIYFFTHTPDTPEEKMDIDVPARLLPKLGIEHHSINLHKMSEDFLAFYKYTTTWPREKHGEIAYSALKEFGSEAVVINSNISEYSQVWFWLPKSKINGKGLALLKGINHPLAIIEFDKWINEAKVACKESGMNVLVLFDIELRARWVSAAFSEYDIAYETFCPYNNRQLFRAELSVNERYRRGRRLDFPIKCIEYMWPEVLIEPINPSIKISDKIKEFVWRSIVHKMITPWFPIWEYIRYLKMKRFLKYIEENTITGNTE